jgi:hypothetical protein
MEAFTVIASLFAVKLKNHSNFYYYFKFDLRLLNIHSKLLNSHSKCSVRDLTFLCSLERVGGHLLTGSQLDTFCLALAIS